jgi:hypothetical protein
VQFYREELDKSKILTAKSLINNFKYSDKDFNLSDIEFSVFSQWGDDGIIQYLIHKLNISNKTFIEFGVGNYLESNTRFLLINNNWRGLIFDGSEKNINFVKNDSIYWKYNLTAKHLFITRENINHEIKNCGFEGEIGILHIDIDGNDYWIWEEINVVNPEIVIMEYNSVFGNKAAISVPYDKNFYVTNAHYSNLFFGASLKAMCHLAEKKNYSFVGSNTNGNNAYFVRNDKLESIKKTTADEGYYEINARQNRNEKGELTFISDHEMIKVCKDLKVINVETNELVPLKNYL